MRRLATALLAACALALAAAPAASADYDFSTFDFTYDANSGGDPATLAGSHPFAAANDFLITAIGVGPDAVLEGELKDIVANLVPGLVGDTDAYPRCSGAEFLATPPLCAPETQLGVAKVGLGNPDNDTQDSPVFHLAPPPGVADRLAFKLLTGIPVIIDFTVSPEPPYNLIAAVRDNYQVAEIFSVDLTLWGVPADPAHDAERGAPSGAPLRPFVTLPRSCEGPQAGSYETTSWQEPDTPATGPEDTPDAFTDCAALGFSAQTDGAPTTNVASSPAGFDFSISVDDPGLTDPAGRAQSDLKKAVVTLPEGITVNPAAAGGLGACSEAELEGEAYDSAPGEGCPQDSKVATVEVQTELLAEDLEGSIFLAEPYSNPLGTLLAGYLVIKQPARGVLLKIPGKIEADSETGQLIASFDQNPRLPFSELEVNFTAGPRAPLTTPPVCGDYEVKTDLYPWADPDNPLTQTDQFTIASAPGGGPCPTDPADQPHAPDFDAGVVEPIAANYSPFVVNLRREESEQRFSEVTIKPPPGLTAKLAATPYCSEAALAAAADRDGKDEQSAPSCPAASRIGTVQAAVGAGPQPYWAPGHAYLAGPYQGAPLSMALITPAVAGPFDLGVVVIRTALRVDPLTAEITAVSDPIPELLEGIPLDVREASIRLDRDEFALNGTNCNELAVGGSLLSVTGDTAMLSERFQLGECRRLGFQPRFFARVLNGKRGVRRSDHPRLRFFLKNREGDANIARVALTLPNAMQIDQSSLGNICSETQLADSDCAGRQPVGAALANTPLLDDPLRGRAYAVSGSGGLPRLGIPLKGQVPVLVRGDTDTLKGARIRNTIPIVPDAPVDSFNVTLNGGRRGYFVNNQHLCVTVKSSKKRLANGKVRRTRRLAPKRIYAHAFFLAHNGARHTQRIPIRSAYCARIQRKLTRAAKRGKRPAARRANLSGGRRLASG